MTILKKARGFSYSPTERPSKEPSTETLSMAKEFSPTKMAKRFEACGEKIASRQSSAKLVDNICI